MEVHKGNEEVRLTNSDMFCLMTYAAKVLVPKVSHLSWVFSGKSKIEKIPKLIITCKHHCQCLVAENIQSPQQRNLAILVANNEVNNNDECFIK